MTCSLSLSLSPAVPPTIIPPGGDARPSATFGESVTLICAASGTPLPTITWMRGGAAVVPSDRIVIETTFTNTTYITSELRVSSVMESDGGSYTCVAVNDASTVTQMFTIEYRKSLNDCSLFVAAFVDCDL